jgi:nuclear pore complex protein Nup98-Nup96
MTESDAGFHGSFKPRWGPMDSLVCAKTDMEDAILGVNQTWKERFSLFSEERDISVLTYNKSGEVCSMALFSSIED